MTVGIPRHYWRPKSRHEGLSLLPEETRCGPKALRGGAVNTNLSASVDALVEKGQVGCALASLTPTAICAEKRARPCLASFCRSNENAIRRGYDVNRPLRWACMTPPRPHGLLMVSDGEHRSSALRAGSQAARLRPSNREQFERRKGGNLFPISPLFDAPQAVESWRGRPSSRQVQERHARRRCQPDQRSSWLTASSSVALT